jgi:hypothetical protein
MAGVPGAVGGTDADGAADARRPTREMLAEGARTFRSLTELNAIPAVVLEGERLSEGMERGEGVGGRAVETGFDDDDAAWIAAASAAVAALLGGDR